MIPTVKKLSLALLIAVSPVLGFAQESTADAETEDAQVESSQGTGSNTAAGTDLSLGTTEQNNAIGSTYVKDTYGDWEMRCIRTENGNDPCQLYQLLVDGNNNSVAEINLFVVVDNPQIQGGATVVTPLETLLTANLRMSVDAGEVKVYPFAFCRTIGCFSRLGLTGEEIAGFKRGARAKVVIVPAAAPDQTVELSASLTGFTKGWEALVALSTPPSE